MSDASIDGVRVEARGPALIIILSNPGRRNAFYPEMRNRMSQVISDAASDPSVRAIILTGEDGHFCSGADLKRVDGADNSALAVRERLKAVHRLLDLIVAGAKPTIAAVEGDAFGAGFSMAVACDVVVAAEGARFGASFVRIGLLPDMGLLRTLPLRIGLPKAKRIMMTGRPVEADEAFAIGMVDELTPRGEALARAVEVADELARVAPLPLAAIKAALAQGVTSLGDVAQLEMNVVPHLADSEDHRAARAAFLNKSTATFVGR
ncbi:MAG: putative enoyl-CoA hydratase [Brevundimonas sp.]|nr:putative enoyl-CoA hydratase [Brevundimonas sp.]